MSKTNTGKYRKVITSKRNGYVEIDVAKNLKIVVTTPTDEHDKYMVFFKDFNSEDVHVAVVIDPNQLISKK